VRAVIGAAEQGVGFGLLVTAFWFGFRHGIDWDHIAAITDITSSQEERRQAIVFGTLYAIGHALVVLVLGVLAIIAGDFIPERLDESMTRVVGATLVLLGVYVFYSLIKHGREFRLRSRWMLVFSGVRRGVHWVKAKAARNGVMAMTTEAADVPVSDWHHGHHGRPGHHHHDPGGQHDAFMNYAKGTAFAVGMIHGVGAETPTQVLIFLTAAGAGGRLVGIAVLVSFIVGLVTSNSIITLGSALGFLKASENFAIYAGVAILTAVVSLVIGTLFILGKETVLPALFGG